MQYSNIRDNGTFAFFAEAKYDADSVIQARSNWWGSADSAVIATLIQDGDDMAECPKVAFCPFAEREWDLSDSVTVDVVDEPLSVLPEVVWLGPNVPNPFNASTRIEFATPHSSYVEVTVYNVLGRPIRQIVTGVLPAGSHRVTWDGRDEQNRRVSGGVYLCRLRAAGLLATRKMLFLP